MLAATRPGPDRPTYRTVMRLALLAGCNERTMRRYLAGLPVRGRELSARIERVVTREGLQREPTAPEAAHG